MIMMESGINAKEVIYEGDIVDSSKSFTGYHKKIIIKDYKLIKNDSNIQANLLKEITVEISYKLGKEEKNINISTYIKKE